MKVFKSKIDSWLLIVFLVIIVVSIFSVILILLHHTSLGDYLISLMIILLGVVLPIWLIGSTKYLVFEDLLLIKSGPFRWKVNISSVSNIRKTKNPLSSPALSLDRLEIKYDKNKSIMISPQNKEDFLRTINKEAI